MMTIMLLRAKEYRLLWRSFRPIITTLSLMIILSDVLHSELNVVFLVAEYRLNLLNTTITHIHPWWYRIRIVAHYGWSRNLAMTFSHLNRPRRNIWRLFHLFGFIEHVFCRLGSLTKDIVVGMYISLIYLGNLAFIRLRRICLTSIIRHRVRITPQKHEALPLKFALLNDTRESTANLVVSWPWKFEVLLLLWQLLVGTFCVI